MRSLDEYDRIHHQRPQDIHENSRRRAPDFHLVPFTPTLPPGEHLSALHMQAYRNEVRPGVFETDANGATIYYASDGRLWAEAMVNRDQTMTGRASGFDASKQVFEDQVRMGREAAVNQAEAGAMGTAVATATGTIAAERVGLGLGMAEATMAGRTAVENTASTIKSTVQSGYEQAQAAFDAGAQRIGAARTNLQSVVPEARPARVGREIVIARRPQVSATEAPNDDFEMVQAVNPRAPGVLRQSRPGRLTYSQERSFEPRDAGIRKHFTSGKGCGGRRGVCADTEAFANMYRDVSDMGRTNNEFEAFLQDQSIDMDNLASIAEREITQRPGGGVGQGQLQMSETASAEESAAAASRGPSGGVRTPDTNMARLKRIAEEEIAKRTPAAAQTRPTSINETLREGGVSSVSSNTEQARSTNASRMVKAGIATSAAGAAFYQTNRRPMDTSHTRGQTDHVHSPRSAANPSPTRRPPAPAPIVPTVNTAMTSAQRLAAIQGRSSTTITPTGGARGPMQAARGEYRP